MKIVTLTVENIKRVGACHVEADGASVITVQGKNGVGKTTVLDSIEYAIGGKTGIPAEPIKEGESRARVVADLGELRVTRVFTHKGSTLLVENADGAKIASPQALLDKLVGQLSFDPLAFKGLKPKDQLDRLKSVVGLDFSRIDVERAGVFEERKETNRRAKDLDAQVRALPTVEAPKEEVSVRDLLAELKRREDTNTDNSTKRHALTVIQDDIEETRHTHSRVAQQIQELEHQRDQLESDLGRLGQDETKQRELVHRLTDANVDEIRDKLANAEEVNAAVRSNKKRATIVQDLKDTNAHAMGLTAKLDSFDQSKAEQLAAADFPVPDLGFGEDGVILNGLPFEQASEAEKLRVSVAMGIALNPKLRVLLVRDASLLDADNLRLLAEMAKEKDCQIWLERVGDEDEVKVVIEEADANEPASACPRCDGSGHTGIGPCSYCNSGKWDAVVE